MAAKWFNSLDTNSSMHLIKYVGKFIRIGMIIQKCRVWSIYCNFEVVFGQNFLETVVYRYVVFICSLYSLLSKPNCQLNLIWKLIFRQGMELQKCAYLPHHHSSLRVRCQLRRADGKNKGYLKGLLLLHFPLTLHHYCCLGCLELRETAKRMLSLQFHFPKN